MFLKEQKCTIPKNLDHDLLLVFFNFSCYFLFDPSFCLSLLPCVHEPREIVISLVFTLLERSQPSFDSQCFEFKLTGLPKVQKSTGDLVKEAIAPNKLNTPRAGRSSHAAALAPLKLLIFSLCCSFPSSFWSTRKLTTPPKSIRQYQEKQTRSRKEQTAAVRYFKHEILFHKVCGRFTVLFFFIFCQCRRKLKLANQYVSLLQSTRCKQRRPCRSIEG